jgi:NADH-quinone oxidoreductase subunit M
MGPTAQGWIVPWLLLAISWTGAALSLFSRPSLYRMKMGVLLTAAANVVATIGWTWAQGHIGTPFLCLLPLVAFLSLLGQPLHEGNRTAWTMTLVLLGLGLGILTAQDFSRDILFVALLALLSAVLYGDRHRFMVEAWRGVVTYGLGMVLALASMVLPPPAASMAVLAASVTLLPLFPFHGGFTAVLTGLPGNVPAFAAVLLPAVGFHRAASLLPDLGRTTLATLSILALAGALYGTVRALSRPRVPPRLSHAALALFSILWWYLADTHAAPAQAAVYLCAVGLAISGLLLAWYSIRARYGDLDVRALGGLVYPMPRFSTLFSLLALAALGMPPFGVFSGFMSMLLNPGFAPSTGFAIILLAWLGASWYFLDLVQRTVFGPQRPDFRYEDLRRTEFASLLTMVVLLLLLGVVSAEIFQPGASPAPDAVAARSPA